MHDTHLDSKCGHGDECEFPAFPNNIKSATATGMKLNQIKRLLALFHQEIIRKKKRLLAHFHHIIAGTL